MQDDSLGASCIREGNTPPGEGGGHAFTGDATGSALPSFCVCESTDAHLPARCSTSCGTAASNATLSTVPPPVPLKLQ